MPLWTLQCSGLFWFLQANLHIVATSFGWKTLSLSFGRILRSNLEKPHKPAWILLLTPLFCFLWRFGGESCIFCGCFLSVWYFLRIRMEGRLFSHASFCLILYSSIIYVMYSPSFFFWDYVFTVNSITAIMLNLKL